MEGKWRLTDSFKIPDHISYPCIVGRTGDYEIVITERLAGKVCTYVINPIFKTTELAMEGDGETHIISCTLLDKDTIVCGKYMDPSTGNTLNDCVSLYDRAWGLIRDIAIPRNSDSNATAVHVAVDMMGKIIACESFQPNIYIIKSLNARF